MPRRSTSTLPTPLTFFTDRPEPDGEDEDGEGEGEEEPHAASSAVAATTATVRNMCFMSSRTPPRGPAFPPVRPCRLFAQ